MNKLKKAALGLMLCAATLLAFPVDAFACTGIYVGSGVTDDGSYFIGRSEDFGKRYRKVFGVEEAKDNAPGTVYDNADEPGGFQWARAAHTYRYTFVRDSSNYWDGNPMAYAEAGQNELGVSVSATVTTDMCDAAVTADPLVGTGITEFNLGSILLGESQTAKSGCALIGNIMDNVGAGENFQFFISDGTEAWLFAGLSGHQWIAFKLPSDMVSVNPNMGKLPAQLDLESPDVLHSEDLVQTATDGEFDRWFDQGKTQFDVFSSYGTEDPGAGQYTRWIQGAYYFNPSFADSCAVTTDGDGRATDIQGLQLLFAPSNTSLSTHEVLRSLAARGEGTAFDANANVGLYALGNDRQAECHFFQVRPGMPEQLKTLEWLCLSRAEFSVFLPSYSALITDVAACYADGDVSHDSADPLTTSVTDALVYTCDDLNDLCEDNRALYGVNVRKYFDNLELEMIAQQQLVDAQMTALYAQDPAAAQAKATEIASKLATDVNAKSELILSELRTYIAAGDTSSPFLPSLMNADGTNKQPLVYASYLVAPQIDQQPQSGSYEKGKTAAPLTVAASVNDGNGALSYEWFVRDGSAQGYSSIATGESFTPSTNEAGTKTYFARVTNAGGLSVDSSDATVTVAEAQPSPDPDPDPKPDPTDGDQGKDPDKDPGKDGTKPNPKNLPTTSDFMGTAITIGALTALSALILGIIAYKKRLER